MGIYIAPDMAAVQALRDFKSDTAFEGTPDEMLAGDAGALEARL